jgi:hypothetical protein
VVDLAGLNRRTPGCRIPSIPENLLRSATYQGHRVRKNRLQIANTPPSATNSRQISKLEVERHPVYGIAALWPADDDIAALIQA